MTRRVGPGDLIFVPQTTIYGPVGASGNRFAAVSIFTPYFNGRKENIEWQRDESWMKLTGAHGVR